MAKDPELCKFLPEEDIPLFVFFHEIAHILQKHPLEWALRDGDLSPQEEHEWEKEIYPLAMSLYLAYKATGIDRQGENNESG